VDVGCIQRLGENVLETAIVLMSSPHLNHPPSLEPLEHEDTAGTAAGTAGTTAGKGGLFNGSIGGPLVFFDVLGFWSVLLRGPEALAANCACLLAFLALLLVDGHKLSTAIGQRAGDRAGNRAGNRAGGGIWVVVNELCTASTALSAEWLGRCWPRCCLQLCSCSDPHHSVGRCHGTSIVPIVPMY
jgi:hypothetical protein